ncbi:pyridoxal phosphate-dependent decarboxylase family protein [Nonomuraea cavernae]|uniref:pyridoxal phosphate-dependent decarboxylase family protein n=1 Tax=Nonomuraea cavernae TaxID=2045107 RepID=UPI0033DDCB6E
MPDVAFQADGSALSRLDRRGPLDVGAEEGARLLAAASSLLVEHAEKVVDGPVAPREPADGHIRDWLAGYDFRTARPAAEVLSEVMAGLRNWTVHTTHPRYFGLFNPTPTWWGVAGELLAAGVNPQLAAHSHAPAAVEMERHVLRFLGARLGMPVTAEGSFTVGGAEANLTAVIVALTRRFTSYPDTGLVGLPGRPVFYASAESHLAWLKIAHLAGLGRQAVRLVPVDASHRMDLDQFCRLHDTDLAAGKVPFLVVGTAGTTGGGALDPLAELADLASERGLHFHVDAAWGGAIALSDRLRPLLAGVHAADSVTVDAHKWLSAPMGAGMFLTPHVEALVASFRVATAYMPAGAEGVADPYTTSVQWSRRHIGLKVFLALAAAGQPAFAEQLERDVALGVLLARRLDENGWHRINDTPLPVVCVVDREADASGQEASRAWHTAVADHVVRSGLAWVSPVLLDGRAAVRLCVTSHRTTARDIELVVAALNTARTAMTSPNDDTPR